MNLSTVATTLRRAGLPHSAVEFRGASLNSAFYRWSLGDQWGNIGERGGSLYVSRYNPATESHDYLPLD